MKLKNTNAMIYDIDVGETQQEYFVLIKVLFTNLSG